MRSTRPQRWMRSASLIPILNTDLAVRLSLSNSLTLGKAETYCRIAAGEPWRRLRPEREENETIHIQDLIRGEVNFQTSELDDKVLLKLDGCPLTTWPIS